MVITRSTTINVPSEIAFGWRLVLWERKNSVAKQICWTCSPTKMCCSAFGGRAGQSRWLAIAGVARGIYTCRARRRGRMWQLMTGRRQSTWWLCVDGRATWVGGLCNLTHRERLKGSWYGILYRVTRTSSHPRACIHYAEILRGRRVERGTKRAGGQRWYTTRPSQPRTNPKSPQSVKSLHKRGKKERKRTPIDKMRNFILSEIRKFSLIWEWIN